MAGFKWLTRVLRRAGWAGAATLLLNAVSLLAIGGVVVSVGMLGTSRWVALAFGLAVVSFLLLRSAYQVWKDDAATAERNSAAKQVTIDGLGEALQSVEAQLAKSDQGHGGTAIRLSDRARIGYLQGRNFYGHERVLDINDDAQVDHASLGEIHRRTPSDGSEQSAEKA